MSKMIDLTGKMFGYWKVLSRAENASNGQARWLCECTACGNKKIVVGGHLRGGRSTNCGCIRVKKMAAANMINEIGNHYGKLTVIAEALTPKNKTGKYWLCKCECGNVITVKGDYLRNGDTKSCGCLLSSGEAKIKSLLDKHNIKYQTQFNFKDNPVKGINNFPLRFDFAIFNDDGSFSHLIEFDGIQHFQPSQYKSSWNNPKNFATTLANDNIKNNYCKNNNIRLIRIAYNQEFTLKDLL